LEGFLWGYVVHKDQARTIETIVPALFTHRRTTPVVVLR
jgi:hypothetical protein